ncbi:MAG: efflux RND transporter periplasmic adaptor subunit [Acidobacteria bacterium]|nr:efflux RND transporter periplasmic adaptor subunit [Acidobacteriota bacterium]
MANGKNGKSRRKWYWIGGITLLIVLAVVGGMKVMGSSSEIDPSKLATVEKGDLARAVVATGKIEPLAKVEVKSKASGIVEHIFVDYGDTVKQGQIMVELDKIELSAQVREARAFLQAAQAAELSAQAAFERNQIDAQGPEIPFLKSSWDRAKKLLNDGLIAQSVLEDAERAYQLGINKQNSARSNAIVAKADVARAKAQVAQAQAALDRAEESLRYSTITSPMNGLVLSRNVEVGNAVSSILVLGSGSTLIFTLGDISEVYVLGKVDEADVGKVFLGQAARIVVESLKEKKYEGKVTKISPLGVEKDNVTTFEVKVSISNPTGELKANMTANAEIILEEKKGVLIIPEAAIIYDKDRNPSVQIPDAQAEGGRKKLKVVLGITNGVKAEVKEGLKEGQKVILQ